MRSSCPSSTCAENCGLPSSSRTAFESRCRVDANTMRPSGRKCGATSWPISAVMSEEDHATQRLRRRRRRPRCSTSAAHRRRHWESSGARIANTSCSPSNDDDRSFTSYSGGLPIASFGNTPGGDIAFDGARRRAIADEEFGARHECRRIAHVECQQCTVFVEQQRTLDVNDRKVLHRGIRILPAAEQTARAAAASTAATEQRHATMALTKAARSSRQACACAIDRPRHCTTPPDSSTARCTKT